jgi:hypothetical protein
VCACLLMVALPKPRQGVLRAPRALVFGWLVDPEELAKWWGPKGFTAPSVQLDAAAHRLGWRRLTRPTRLQSFAIGLSLGRNMLHSGESAGATARQGARHSGASQPSMM